MNTEIVELRTSINKNDVKIDFDNRIINGVVAIEPIDVKDYREFSIDDNFVNDLVRLANKQKSGVMSNFGHNYNNLGKRLGRAKNWRVEEGKAKYDLHIFESADKSPGMEGMGTWVMSMANEDEKAIMNSIRFMPEYFFQKDSGGKELKVYVVKDGKSSKWVEPNQELGKVYVKIADIKATDIVDEGAATNTLLSTNEEENGSLLNKVVDLIKGLFNTNHSAPTTEEQNILSINKESMDTTKPVETSEALAAANALIKEKDEKITELGKKLEDQKKESETTLGDLAKRMEALEKKPAAPETVLNTGQGGEGKPEEEPLWMQNPINKEAQERFDRRSKSK